VQLQARIAERATGAAVPDEYSNTASMVNYSAPIRGAKKFEASAFASMSAPPKM
jgi:hypothetical protein